MTPEGEAPPQGTRPPLAVLACAGPLPIEVAEAAVRAGRAVFVVGIDGFAGDEIARFPHARVNIGQIGAMLAAWRKAGCRDLVIAGAMRRPNLLRIKVDGGFFRAIGTALSLTRGGDDSILRRIIRFFEREGLRVVGPQEVAPHLLAGPGPLARHVPEPASLQAIERASAVLADLGRFDVGQAAIATADRLIALEGVGGTDGLLRSAGGPARGGVLVKMPKPSQEMRIDLPTIGPETLRRAAEAGLAGIAISAGQSLVLERDEVARLADEAGLFVTGLAPFAERPVERLAADSPLSELLGRPRPRTREARDIAIGAELLDTLAPHAAGQAVVVSGEHVLAIDCANGPIAMLARLERGSHWGLRVVRKRIGVLVLRSSALRTNDGAAIVAAVDAAGLAGIALAGKAAGHEPSLTAALGARGLFLVRVSIASHREPGGAA
jgi:DUF1009 family protein